MLYETIEVDKSLFKLELEVVYTCGGRSLLKDNIITNEAMKFFIDKNSISIQHYTLFCVTVQRKVVHASTSDPQTIVADTNPWKPTFLYDDGLVMDLNANHEELKCSVHGVLTQKMKEPKCATIIRHVGQRMVRGIKKNK